MIPAVLGERELNCPGHEPVGFLLRDGLQSVAALDHRNVPGKAYGQPMPRKRDVGRRTTGGRYSESRYGRLLALLFATDQEILSSREDLRSRTDEPPLPGGKVEEQKDTR
jgi:hypothetical protein